MKNEIFGSAQFGLAYNTSALESILKEELGECTMDDVKHPRYSIAVKKLLFQICSTTTTWCKFLSHYKTERKVIYTKMV